MNNLVLLFVTSIFLSSCAVGYKNIAPSSLNFSKSQSNDDFDFGYKHGILTESGNKRYAKKEIKNNVHLIALEFTNKTEQHIIPSKDLIIKTGDRLISPMNTEAAFKSLNQKPGIYCLYLLLSPLRIFSTSNTTNVNNSSVNTKEETDFFPIGLILGPGITLGNVLGASSANRKFKDELLMYDFNNAIPAGQKGNILIAVPSTSLEHISIELVKNK